MGPRADLDGCGKSRLPNGIRSPDRLVRRESLYRLSCRAPVHISTLSKLMKSLYDIPPWSSEWVDELSIV